MSMLIMGDVETLVAQLQDMFSQWPGEQLLGVASDK